MCLQDHEPVRQVTTKSGKIAFKCNCSHYHPYDRLEPNEMDASVCIPKDDIKEESQREPVFSKPKPALNLQPVKEEPRSGNWGGSTY